VTRGVALQHYVLTPESASRKKFWSLLKAKLDELVKSQKTVIPAKAGIHK
jgi:hypothetical protein